VQLGASAAASGLPFLFDTSSMPTRSEACGHCQQGKNAVHCCGVCVFEEERCEMLYPGQSKSEGVAKQLRSLGYNLQVGKSGWWMGTVRGGEVAWAMSVLVGKSLSRALLWLKRC